MIVINSSPAINLGRALGGLAVLSELYGRVVVPFEVMWEIETGVNRDGKRNSMSDQLPAPPASNTFERIKRSNPEKVPQIIHELGGTMPENLPVAESIKKVASREKKRLKAEQKKSAGEQG